MIDPIADLIGDYRAFTALQRDRLAVLLRRRDGCERRD